MGRIAGIDGRARVLDAAADLFYRRGIESVSMDEVVAASALTKRAVYYHFQSKQALVHAYLEAADEPALALLRGLARGGQGGHPFEQILTGLRKWMRSARFHGCAFLRASKSLPDDPVVRELALRHKDATLEWLEGVARAEGAAEPERLARQFRLLVDALLCTGHLYPPDALVDSAQELLQAMLQGAGGPASAARGPRRTPHATDRSPR